MIALTDLEVFEALCEAFEISYAEKPRERSYNDLDDSEKLEVRTITAKLNNKLALKQSGSA